MQLKLVSSESDLLRGSLSTSDGVDLYVEVRGKGTPCLYVHGGPASGSYWARKFAGDVLEKHFRMIYLDQRGACRSSSPQNGDFSMNRLVEDFEEVRKALSIDRWLTMGHSFGGLTTYLTQAIEPLRVQGFDGEGETRVIAVRHDDGIAGLKVAQGTLHAREARIEKQIIRHADTSMHC